MAGAWRRWDRILLCFEFNFCFKAVPAHWERIIRFKDGSSGCLLLKLVLSGPSELGPDFTFL